MQAAELWKRMKYRHSTTVLDVRSRSDFKSGHIPRAVHAPCWKILLHLALLPVDKASLLVVASDRPFNTVLAMALLRLRGYDNVKELDGQFAGWRRSGHAVES